jgi:Ca2+-binding RTX toxin-like protein
MAQTHLKDLYELVEYTWDYETGEYAVDTAPAIAYLQDALSADYAAGSERDEILSSMGGDSVLVGGAGNDTIIDTSWDRRIAAELESAASILEGGAGNDVLHRHEHTTSADDYLNKEVLHGGWACSAFLVCALCTDGKGVLKEKSFVNRSDSHLTRLEAA